MRSAPIAAALVAIASSLWPSGAAAASNGTLAFSVQQPVETCDQCGPDGNSESFGGGSRVWLVRPDGSERRRLPCTSEGGSCSDGDPAFTHDGRRLAVVGLDGLVVMHPDGRHIQRVDPFPGWSPSWGPRGRRLAFAASVELSFTERLRGVGITDLEGTRRVIYPGPSSEVVWSRKGRLAWTVFRPYHKFSDLWTGDPGGRRRTRIARHAESASWSPDGSRIAFLGPRGLFVVDADGDRRRRLTRACGIGYDGEGGVAWSPDGAEIACRSRGGGVAVVALRTMTVRRLVPWRSIRSGSVDDVAWQPAASP